MERYNQNQEVNRNNIPYNTIIPQSFENYYSINNIQNLYPKQTNLYYHPNLIYHQPQQNLPSIPHVYVPREAPILVPLPVKKPKVAPKKAPKKKTPKKAAKKAPKKTATKKRKEPIGEQYDIHHIFDFEGIENQPETWRKKHQFHYCGDLRCQCETKFDCSCGYSPSGTVPQKEKKINKHRKKCVKIEQAKSVVPRSSGREVVRTNFF